MGPTRYLETLDSFLTHLSGVLPKQKEGLSFTAGKVQKLDNFDLLTPNFDVNCSTISNDLLTDV